MPDQDGYEIPSPWARDLRTSLLHHPCGTYVTNTDKARKAHLKECKREHPAYQQEIMMATGTKKSKVDNSNVPPEYLGTNGKFKPGLDARYKSDLVLSVLGETSDKSLHKFSKQAAEERLKERGWLAFLDKARAVREAREAKKATAAAKKAEADAAKAEIEGTSEEPPAEETPKPRRSRRKAQDAAA
jgi:hypothetical protein